MGFFFFFENFKLLFQKIKVNTMGANPASSLFGVRSGQSGNWKDIAPSDVASYFRASQNMWNEQSAILPKYLTRIKLGYIETHQPIQTCL